MGPSARRAGGRRDGDDQRTGACADHRRSHGNDARVGRRRGAREVSAPSAGRVPSMSISLRRRRALLVPRVAELAASRVVQLAAVAALMAWAVHAHARDLGAPLWIDEGISLGVAQHALSAIPGVLVQDGAPPLFYVLLHLWGSAFGFTGRSGHGFSLACAVLAIPAAYTAACVPFGGRAGVLAAAVVALDPFAATYAIEIRMYSLLLLVGLLATGALLRALVVHPGHRGWAVAGAVAVAAVMYTHNWGLFYTAAAGLVWLALVAAAPRDGRRPVVVSGLIVFAGALVLLAPWIPTLLDQTRHTRAPWSHAPPLASIGH